MLWVMHLLAGAFLSGWVGLGSMIILFIFKCFCVKKGLVDYILLFKDLCEKKDYFIVFYFFIFCPNLLLILSIFPNKKEFFLDIY